MKDFIQWLKEDGQRTSLGIYPPAYGVAQYPPAYFAPISATAFLSLSKIHGKDIDGKPSKKKKKKKTEKKKE